MLKVLWLGETRSSGSTILSDSFSLSYVFLPQYWLFPKLNSFSGWKMPTYWYWVQHFRCHIQGQRKGILFLTVKSWASLWLDGFRSHDHLWISGDGMGITWTGPFRVHLRIWAWAQFCLCTITAHGGGTVGEGRQTSIIPCRTSAILSLYSCLINACAPH